MHLLHLTRHNEYNMYKKEAVVEMPNVTTLYPSHTVLKLTTIDQRTAYTFAVDQRIKWFIFHLQSINWQYMLDKS